MVWFSLPLHALAPLHSLTFVRPEPDNDLFWSFISHCRRFPDGPPPDADEHSHRYSHPAGGNCYDMVSGPVAAEWPVKGKTHFRRQVYAGYDQFSFHTPAAAVVFNNLLRGGRGVVYDWYTINLP